MSIDDIRTTKKDPNSTIQFCSGTLKLVYPIKILKDADETRQIAKLDSITKISEEHSVTRSADTLSSNISYTIQPTDDGKKVYAELDAMEDQINVFSEVIASSLLKPMWERVKSANIVNDVVKFREDYIDNTSEFGDESFANAM